MLRHRGHRSGSLSYYLSLDTDKVIASCFGRITTGVKGPGSFNETLAKKPSLTATLNRIPTFWPRRLEPSHRISSAPCYLKHSLFDVGTTVTIEYVHFCCHLGRIIIVKVKVKVTLQQATKTQRWSRGIALLFL